MSTEGMLKLLDEFKAAAVQCNDAWSQQTPPEPPVKPCGDKYIKYKEILYAACCECNCDEACKQLHDIAYELLRFRRTHADQECVAALSQCPLLLQGR